MRSLVTVLVLAGVVAGVPGAAALDAQDRGLRIERVFGPEVPTGRYKHPASITELRSGDLYLVYYGGEGEYATDTAVFGARLTKGTTSWSAPAAIARDPFRSLGNAVIWQGPDGLVWLFYVVRFGETWSTSRIQAKVSRDDARTWSDAFMISVGEGMMVRNRPIVLSNGDYLLPVYHETGHDTETVGPDSTSLFLRYDVRKKRWTETGRIRSRTGNIQPAVVEISESHLIAYCRRGGGYGATTDGYLVRAESHDGGATWSEGRNSAFPNPNSAVEFLELASGSLLLVYNDSMTQRTPLTAALSTDGDRTYAYRRNIAEGRDSFAYPIGFQASDGLIHIVYTSQQRTVINHATFSEAWVKGAAGPGSPAAPGASPAPASFAAPQPAPNPRQQPGAQVHIYAPEQHDLYDGHFVISANRIYMAGGLNDPEGWDHLDNEAKNVRPVAGTAEIDVNEIKNTGTFTAKLKIPEGDLVLAIDRWHEFSPCQNGGIVAYIHEHGTDSGCGDNNWPKTVGFLAGWGFGHATLNGKPLYQDYEMHFMVTQGLRDRKTLRVNHPLPDKKLPGGETNPATQQIDFYIRSPQPNPKNKPARQVFLHFFGMEITWK